MSDSMADKMANKTIALGIFLGALVSLAALASVAEDADSQSSVTRRQTIIQSTKSESGSGSGASAVSSETSVESSGVRGVAGANKFVPKFRQRLDTYREQIQMGETKGWLTADEVARFRQEHARLEELEDKTRTGGYQKADVDNLEAQITKFNGDLHKASNKPAAAAAPPASPPAGPTAQPMRAPASKATAARPAAKKGQGKPAANKK